MASSPTIDPDRRYLSIVAEVPAVVSARLVSWRASQGLVGPVAESCHITILISEDAGGAPLRSIEQAVTGIGPVQVDLGPAATFEPVTPVTYLPVVAGADRLTLIHAACQKAVGESVSPFPYEPHLTLANHAPAPALAASLRDFATLPPALAHFTVNRLTVYRFSAGSWQQLGTVRL
ncbi:2'-5' RNA ligase family protein [Rothia nasimurium]|uniref:2'-5' RNA ligase family protein n=1 Tax=Rothia nasimurium TaxID=85336 RepID=UPI001F398A4B|nr:2'-5' RNA ligase family protein [Rothia nasimurium]